MDAEKIKVKMESGKNMEVVVFSKRATVIEIVLGEGVHSVKCELKPTRNGLAFVGTVMGREIIYERSAVEVQEDIDRVSLDVRNSLSAR
ncbi:MAG: hypothetical protein QNL62_06970 [Gammaproteobacteria bacterium]|nr:hypothetical protein [Gammaproteobacteria bacterium]